jgi:DNA-binding response OmpR family regulator
MQRILVIEDDPAVRRTLKRLFKAHGYVIDLAPNGSSGLKLFKKNSASAVVLDLDLPDISGHDVCREITRIAPERPIVVLSAISDTFEKVLLLEMGARDYVTKPFSPRELLARIRAALRMVIRDKMGNTFNFGTVSVDFSTRQVTRSGISVLLTKKECAVLKFLIHNAERVVSRQEVLDNVWNYTARRRTRTIDQHIFNLRTKLEKDPAHPVHFQTVFSTGYKFVP